MNGKDEILKRRLYYEGLKQAIAAPLMNESFSVVDEVIQDDEVEDDIKESPKKAYKRLNAYTKQIYENTRAAWKNLEADYWQMFGMGF